MNTESQCLSCFRDQIIRAARIQGCDSETLEKVLIGVDQILDSISMNISPPEIASLAYRHLAERTGIYDPYLDHKKKSTQLALSQVQSLKNIVQQAKDPLRKAVELAGLGNMIDYGADANFDLERDLDFDQYNISNEFHIKEFKTYLARARSILYLADNAGETVFDRILIEAFDIPVTYAVKSFPIINDALFEDAKDAGIDHVATIIRSGTNCPGTILHTCTNEFIKIFEDADLIISKGQGNYEALSDENRPIFFLLKVKCDLISRQINAPLGSLVFKGINIKN